MRRLNPLLALGVATALAAPLVPVPAPSAAAQATAVANPSGLWQGAILYAPGKTEVDIVVELAQAPDGRWSGTIDLLPHGLQYQPLDEVSVEGSKLSFLFVRQSPTAGRVESPFEGELSADGSTIHGEFIEGRQNHHAFVLRRIGEAGDPRPEPRFSDLQPLSGDAAELREAFNRDTEAVRLVMLLSPS